MMDCTEARGLIPRYLDDELRGERAAHLREHLIDCPGCRTVVQEGKALSAWFVAPQEVPVPEGFAARVARRAVAGDAGSGVGTSTAPRGWPLEPVVPERRAGTGGPSAHLTSFLVSAAAVAATLLLGLSIALQRLERPAGNELEAQYESRERSIEALRALNEDAPADEEDDG